MTSILIVEDEYSQRVALRALVHNQMGYDVVEAENGQDALDQLETVSVDVVILDIEMPVKGGLETLQEMSQLYPDMPVIMLTGFVEHAVEAMTLGAIDYLTKPIEAERLSVAVFHALKMRYMSQELDRYKRDASGALTFKDIVGHDGGLMNVISEARKIAANDVAALITGEEGVGKELLARAIHGESLRTGAPFITINCAAIPERLFESTMFGAEENAISTSLGKFREAEGGTLYLDKIGELRLDQQEKLLNALQQKEIHPVGSNEPIQINVRVIASTHRDLAEEVQSGFFNQELLAMFSMPPLNVPTLNAHKQDIPELINHFIEKFVVQHNLPLRDMSAQASAFLAAQPWPGNVRELENALHRIIVLSNDRVITLEEVKNFMTSESTSVTGEVVETSLSNPTLKLIDDEGKLLPLDVHEKRAIEFALYYHKNNITQAAKSLGMAKPTLYRRLSEYKLDAA